MKIDLHIHSNYSDGVLSVFQIIDEAVKNKAQIISITDHDSIKGYSKKLFDYAKEKNITLIPGVEISTKYQGFGVHILGYNIDLNNEKLNNLLENSQKNRIDYLENVANKLRNFGYEINTHKLKELESVTKAHTARYGLWILGEDIFINSPYHDEDLKLLVETHDTREEDPLDFVVSDAIATVAGNIDSINSPHHRADMKLIATAGSDCLQMSCSYPKSSLNNLAINKVSLTDKYHSENI